MRHFVITVGWIFILLQTLTGQNPNSHYFLQENNPLLELSAQHDASGWLYFEPNVIKKDQLLTHHRRSLGLDEDGTLVLHRSLDDRKRKNINSSEMKHQKYYQYYKGIRIEAVELSVHTDKEDWIRVMHGDILHGMKFTIENTISEKVAFSNALKHMGAETYAWEIKAPDEDLALPEGELIFARINGPEIVPENFTLCYRFDIVSVKPHENKAVYVPT